MRTAEAGSPFLVVSSCSASGCIYIAQNWCGVGNDAASAKLPLSVCSTDVTSDSLGHTSINTPSEVEDADVSSSPLHGLKRGSSQESLPARTAGCSGEDILPGMLCSSKGLFSMFCALPMPASLLSLFLLYKIYQILC